MTATNGPHSVDLHFLATESPPHALLLPNLTYWEIEGNDQYICEGQPYETAVIAPKLTHLKLHTDRICELVYLETSPLLRQIELDVGWLWRGQLNVFSTFPELESITLLVMLAENIDHFDNITPISSPLRHLKTNAFYFLLVFTKMAPTIQHLELVPFPSRSYYNKVASSLEFTTPNKVTRLTIHAGRNRILAFPKFEKLLALSPMIKHLSIVYHPKGASLLKLDGNPFLRILSKPKICTRLESLAVENVTFAPDMLKKLTDKMARICGDSSTLKFTVTGGEEKLRRSLMLLEN